MAARQQPAAGADPAAGSDELQDAARPGQKASVVVCTYTEERWARIRLALDSLACQTMPAWQVIVVSDSNPALLRRLAAEYPDLDVVPNEFPRGLSGARNSGIAQAHGDIIVFLDDDARAEPNWIERLLAAYEDESVLGVGGLVLADWDTGRCPGWLPPEFLWVVGCSYVGLPGARAAVRNPIGANMSFRRAAFDAAGMFDTSVGRNDATTRPLGCEETEFSLRLLRARSGGRIVYEPQAVVHHYVAASRGTWRYFLSRCYAEGYSKARVARLAGMAAALSTERSYVFHTLARAALRELGALARRRCRAEAFGRLAALVLGVGWGTAGYLCAAAAAVASPGRGKVVRR